jgi:hypothetical protein
VPGQRAAAGDEYYETAVRKHATGAPADESAGAAVGPAAGAPGERAGVGRPPS